MLSTLLLPVLRFALKWGLILAVGWWLLMYVFSFFGEPSRSSPPSTSTLPRPRPDVIPTAPPSPVMPAIPPGTRTTPTSPEKKDLGPVLTAKAEGIRFEVADITVNGTTLKVRIRATNEGFDRILRLTVTGPAMGPSKTRCYDQHGNVYSLSRARIGNSRPSPNPVVESLLVANVPTEVEMEFFDTPVAAGQSTIQEVKLLQVDGLLFAPENQRRGVSEQLGTAAPSFRDIPVGGKKP